MFAGIFEFLSQGVMFWMCVIGILGWWFRKKGGLSGIFGDAAADEIKKRAKDKALDIIRKRIGK